MTSRINKNVCMYVCIFSVSCLEILLQHKLQDTLLSVTGIPMQVPHIHGNLEIMQSHTELALLVLSGMVILGEASQGEDLCKVTLQQHKKKSTDNLPETLFIGTRFPTTADSPNPLT